ncbi:DUF3592 domain-containing protein [Streptomyces hiroshimensis]|uniref:DUF3592 domain-containing protein n=1 Tax=Streptomyces hiroshimensis TaxID=66424 RepID=A0ABQ2Z0K6_9ACTN|nr:DUF3592 domain-containing protein [Streptomyces hiroshimensis]GGY00825.1 hypothetical protein GCM10010324_54340 [Streptomyces hiroshimensis]
MEREWLFSLIPLTIGVVFLGFGVYGLRRARALRRTGVTAKARIVRHEVRRDDDGATYKHPVAAWTAQDGRTCEYSSRFGRGAVGNNFGVGAYVMVRYDPQAPHRFEIEGWDMKAIDLLFTVLGSIFTAGTMTVVLVRLLTL